MRVTFDLPDDLAGSLGAPSQDPAQAALEALGLEAYRRRRISGYQLRMLLGIPSRWDLDAFLKERQVETYTAEDFDKDWAIIQEARKKHTADVPA